MISASGPWKGSTGGVARFRRPRIALYSHDTMGLGHVRRNLLIAQTLSCSPLAPEVLLITGALHADAFKLPPRTSWLILPPFHKGNNGEYRPGFPGTRLQTLIEFRSAAIYAGIEEFDPDLLIVDKVVRGVLRELDPTLEFLRNRKTQCILGLRDVLDSPSVVRQEWQDEQFENAVREFYSYIWVYGDPKVYNLVEEYRLAPDLKSRVIFTGYHNQRLRLPDRACHQEPSPYVLCLVGGGQDGAQLVEAFAQCEIPERKQKIVLTGPFLPRSMRKRLARLAAKNSGLRVLDFLTEPAALVAQADRVIAMGGYNTVCEILSHQKSALIVPRIHPRREQLIRAERLHAMQLVDYLPWDFASSRALSNWLHKETSEPEVQGRINMSGLERITVETARILSTQTSKAACL